MNSHGKRYIGDNVADYGADDLVLVPPDLPHTWSSNRSLDTRQPQVAIVIWFSGDWARRLADCCPEYESLRRLLRRAASGLAFSAETGATLRAQQAGLLSEAPRERLASAVNLLCMLADAPGHALASPGAFAHRGSGGATGHEPERINRVLAIIDTRFAEALSLAELAAAAHLSERSLHRYFVQHLGLSVGRYINRVRIGHACRMLADTGWPVSMVGARAGFANVANFNRQFKAAKETTPAAYRRQFAGQATTVDAEPVALEQRPASLVRRTR